jgi:hypothetical protein
MNITKIDPDFTPETHTVGNTSAQSSVIITGSGLVRIATTTDTHVKFGTNPTATTEDVLVPENHVEVFVFKSGEKIAFIHHGGGSGKINITVVD